MAWVPACFLALAASAAAVVMTDKPVTAAVAVPERVRHSKVILLQLEGVTMRRNAPAVWNVFWELQDANVETSVDNAHFAGYVTSIPNSAARDVKPVNFTLELPAAAVAAIQRQQTIHFTFVPMRKLPEGGVSITTLRLE
jgi:hypothetical protein